MTVRVVTDSTADLPPQLAHQLRITVVPVYVRFGEKVYRDGVDISHDEFYQKLVASPIHPTTSQPSPSDFADVYRKLAKETEEIVSIQVTSKLSGTYNSALQGRELAGVRCRIEVIDSLSTSMGLGLIAMAAVRLATAGESLQTIMEEIRQTIPNIHLLGFFDTLKYLLRGGRIGKAKALLGSILNVKPLITMRDGELFPAGQVRTRFKGIERLFDLVRNTSNIEEIAIVHSTTPDEAGSLEERIASIFDKKRVHITRLGPALGAHGGPGTLILALREKISSISQDANEGKPSRKRFLLPPLRIPRLSFSRP
ncbi:MAG: DegV family protein [Deltaproteobacteria bacterium]|nr:DegV family protein [Deltaproteobacteria bacterium]